MLKLPYYGTYHHTTYEQSEMIRSILKDCFIKEFQKISHDHVREILDAGCGLGYLSELSAVYFPGSKVTGVDLFGSRSLPEGEMSLAIDNMKALKLEERVKFVKSDLSKLSLLDETYDLAVSNLVYHNLGRSRFEGYRELARVIRTGGYFIIGDLFHTRNRDIEFLESYFYLLNKELVIPGMPRNYSLFLFKKR
ncbi:MAG: class I SAM-dependent methyltransferase [Thermoplasmataceae archaeon]